MCVLMVERSELFYLAWEICACSKKRERSVLISWRDQCFISKRERSVLFFVSFERVHCNFWFLAGRFCSLAILTDMRVVIVWAGLLTSLRICYTLGSFFFMLVFLLGSVLCFYFSLNHRNLIASWGWVLQGREQQGLSVCPGHESLCYFEDLFGTEWGY